MASHFSPSESSLNNNNNNNVSNDFVPVASGNANSPPPHQADLNVSFKPAPTTQQPSKNVDSTTPLSQNATPTHSSHHYGTTSYAVKAANLNQTHSGDDSDTETEDSTPLLMASSSSNSMSLSMDTPTAVANDPNFHCHSRQTELELERLNVTKMAKKRLIAATICCLLFATGEGLAGYFSGSYAIMSDAAHMMSDFANLVIGIVAIHLGSKPPRKRYNYGLIRAEVLGALASVILVWEVAAWIFYESIYRLKNRDFEIQSIAMVVAAALAFLFNIFLLFLLRGTGHGHSHGGGGHGHSHTNSTGHTRFENEDDVIYNESASNSSEQQQRSSQRSSNRSSTIFGQHINIQAATAHVLGDLAMSGGVFIVSGIIYFYPSMKILDPICSLILCFVVVYTTVRVFGNTMTIFLEGCPRSLNYDEIFEDLGKVNGVKHVHDLRVWGLTLDKNCLNVHLAVDGAFDKEDILQEALIVAKTKHKIELVTIQVENLKSEAIIGNCNSCRPVIR